METKEKGITLITLVVTIIVLLILVSVGTISGISTINSMAFNEYKNELKVMQTKVNELNISGKTNLGQELISTQKNLLDLEVISNIIYKDVTEEEKTEIEEGFRFFDVDSIKNQIGLDGIKREYLINVEYRFVICYQGFKYEENTYYMIDQIENEIYNVRYQDKNDESGDFEVNIINENNRWKIEISDIQYNGYINNWQTKYKKVGDEYWNTSNGLNFYVIEEGNYYVKVVYKDEVDLGTKIVTVTNEE